MKLYDENGPKYIRLDDDVSFALVRTNPKLTSNTKLMYDGENLYMESYDAAPILSTTEYKHHRVWKTGLFNRDIRNFLLGSNTAAFEVGQNVGNTIVLNNFDNQFENMYWCGVESINSDRYPQEMGCVAPLYLRKKRPNYFVIFKITNPSNFNLNENDTKFDFNEDILKNASIIKSFDLREGTVLGDYIKRYVEQRDFKYDQSVYVNFSSHEIYFYGIDRKLGVLTQKVENIEDQLLDNDNTIMRVDDWITSGFERNNLIFPYIINLEFLFDDNDIEDYKFARYFGMYVNDIDLYDLKVSDCIPQKNKETNRVEETYVITDMDTNNVYTSSNRFYYIKDKYRNIYTARSMTALPNFFRVPGAVDPDNFQGYETSSISTYVERLEGAGHATMVLSINDELTSDASITIYNTISGAEFGRFIGTGDFPAGQYRDNRFSYKGKPSEIAEAIAGAIREASTGELDWITATSSKNYVIIKAYYPGENMNGLFDIRLDNISSQYEKITKVTEKFTGGSDVLGCLFKVYTSDKDMFFDTSGNDRDQERYFKCGYGRTNAKIIAFLPYINENGDIDDTYSVVVTDKNGPYVNVAKTDQAEIVDLYYPRFGVLSFFPVRDFDFDTVSSAYGEYSMMQKELDDLDNNNLLNNPNAKKGDILEKMPYGRFFYHNDVKIDNEYAYYVENILPELATLNKTVPFIAKWGYIDEAKDSCENPYRLNTSKIFETCNFSANTFMQQADLMEYTHSMPYYISDKNLSSDEFNEYQYIYKNSVFDNGERIVWDGSYDQIVSYFSKTKKDTTDDPFDEVFGDVTLNSRYKNKRFNKKYSRFLLGSDINRATTLFRGVKFEIREYEKSKEVYTGKYNDYRFSVVYLKGTDPNPGQPIKFIKNDSFKFIVGVIYFDTLEEGTNVQFNKSSAYALSMGVLGVNDLPQQQTEDESGTYVDNGGGSSYNPGYNYDDSTAGSGSGGSSGGSSGGNSGGGSSGETVENHYGEDTAGGEANYNDEGGSYSYDEDGTTTTVTIPTNNTDPDPEPEPEPAQPTNIVSQTFNLPVSSATPEISEPIRMYSNGDYRVMSQNVSGTPSVEGTMIEGLTSNATGIKLNNSDYTFSDSEFVQTAEGDYEELSYTTIPADTFSYANQYDVYVNYTGGVTSSNSVTVSLPFMYDTSRGSLRIYENGKYRYFSDDEDNTIKSVEGMLIPELANYQNVHLYEHAVSFNRNFTNSETVMDGNEEVTLKYATITHGGFLSVKDSSETTLKKIKLVAYDSTVTIQFKYEKISIDRSNSNSLLGTTAQHDAKQLPYERLEYYLEATDRDGNSVGLNHEALTFYINTYKPGSTAYNGNVVSIYDDGNKNVNGWVFKESCTWKKDAYDIIHVTYGNNTDAAQMRIELVDGNPNQILLRGFKPVDDFESKTFIEGRSYFVKEFIQHIPEDANFDTVHIYNNYPLDTTMVEQKCQITDSNNRIKPQTWEEFYNDKVFTMLNPGTVGLHYGWYGGSGENPNVNLSSFGGKMTFNITSNKVNYEVEDGDMKVYEDGTYSIGSTSGTLNLNIPENEDFYLKLIMYVEYRPYTQTHPTEYHFSDDQKEGGKRYVVIPGTDFEYPGTHKLYMMVDGRKYDDFVKLVVTDRNFVLTFNTSEIIIDRSIDYSFAYQMEQRYNGLNLIDYVNVPTDSKIQFDASQFYVYLNNFKRDSTGRAVREQTGNALCLNSVNGMLDSTWKKDQQDKLYMKYGYLGYTDNSYNGTDGNGFITVKTVDSIPGVVYLKGITDDGFNHKFNVGQAYTLRDMFGFYPGDTSHFSLKMSKFEIHNYDPEKLSVTVVGDIPTTWHDFYDNYMRIKVLKSGRVDCYVWWETNSRGGDHLIRLNGVTDGSGKPQSSSGSASQNSSGTSETTINLAKSYVPVLQNGVNNTTVSITNTGSHTLTINNSTVPDWIDNVSLTKESLKFNVLLNPYSKSRTYNLEVTDNATGYTYPCVVSQDGYVEEVLAPEKPVPEQSLIFELPKRNVKVYDNGTYAIESAANDVGIMRGTFFTDVPSNASINFYMRQKTYELDQTETVNGVTHKYALIPYSDFDITSHAFVEKINRLHINYKSGTKESTFVEIFMYDYVYDVQDGQMKLYENGYCSIGNKYKFQLTTVKNDDFTYYVREFGGYGPNYEFSDDVKEHIMYNGEMTELRYVLIPVNDVFTKPGMYQISVDYHDGNALGNTKIVFVYDSQLKLTFKEDSKTLWIDRSQQGALKRQFDEYHGVQLRDYVDINVDNVIMNVGTVESIYNSLTNLGSFYINKFVSGQSVYTEDGIEITHLLKDNNVSEWCFTDCTWKSEAIDKIYLRYGNQTFGSMTVRTFDSDTRNIYIKGVDCEGYGMKVGVTYTLRDVLTFKPADANFEFLEIGRVDWENPFWISGSTEYFRIEKPSTLPNTWEEFYNGYKITPLKEGKSRLYYTYRSVESSIGGCGDIIIRITNP